MIAPAYLSPAIDYIDSWLETQTRLDQQTPGYSIAIAHQGQVVYKRGFGVANKEAGENMTPDHLFRIASHSKTFTATAIMQLMEASKLSIHDPASQYAEFLLENPDERIHRVTIAELLSHSSGIGRDGNDASFWLLARPFPDRREVIDFFKTQPLVIDSRQRFKYSNFAYALLGWIIQSVSEQSYADYMTQHILDPLGLGPDQIGPEYNPDVGSYITGYSSISPNGNQARISAELDTRDMFGATSFYANAESLCNFYSAMMPNTDKLLSDRSKREMLRQHWAVPDSPDKQGYGLGFSHVYYDDHHLIGNGGGMPGNITRTYFDPDKRIVVSVLSNGHSGRSITFQKGVLHILDYFETHYDAQSNLLKYQGKFYDLWGMIHTVAMGDKIVVSSPGGTKPFDESSELEQVEGNLFKSVKEIGYGSYGEQVEFIMDGDQVEKINYAGYPKLNQQDYEDFIQDLDQKYQSNNL